MLHNQFRNALYSANNVGLTYISALFGFLCKTLSTMEGYGQTKTTYTYCRIISMCGQTVRSDFCALNKQHSSATKTVSVFITKAIILTYRTHRDISSCQQDTYADTMNVISLSANMNLHKAPAKLQELLARRKFKP